MAMAWPTPQDYNEAIQNPKLNLSDEQLRDGKPEVNRFQLPVARSGAFATVYRMQCPRGTFGVKFFLTEAPDRQQRYDEIGRYLNAHRLPYMIDFSFQPQGVKFSGLWYPLLKMEWVQGQTLDAYIQTHLKDSSVLANLAQEWLTMIKDLQQQGIAHGDLQHGNVLIQNGALRLIDYDDMYVPALSGRTSPENGHRNYQHPGRNGSHFGPYIDNFSAWIIYLSLVALSIEPSLWSGGGECVLFSADDFSEPNRSVIFARLEAVNDRVLDQIPYLIRELLLTEITQIPPLNELQSGVRPIIQPSNISNPTQWWKTGTPPAQTARDTPSDSSSLGSQWVLEYLTPVSEVRFTGEFIYQRVVLLIILELMLTSLGLTYLRFVSWPSTLAISAAGVVLAIVALVIGYRSQPEVAQRRRLLSELKDAHAAAGAGRGRLGEIEKEQRDALQIEQRELSAIQSTQRQIDMQEKKELTRIDSESLKSIATITAKRQNLVQLRSKEFSDSLRFIQERWVNDTLARHDLRNAKIPGIGPELQRRLVGAGIKTAADISGYTLSSSAYGMSSKVYLRRPSGPVSVPGVGQRKADALLSWRMGLLASIKSRQPSTLPSDISNMITSKYQAAIANLDLEESKARNEGRPQKEALRARFLLERDKQSAKYREALQRFERLRRDLSNKIQPSRDELRTHIFKEGNLERQFRSFAKVTPVEYLRTVIGIH